MKMKIFAFVALLLALMFSPAIAQSRDGQPVGPFGPPPPCAAFGTGAGTCTQGNDGRITGALQTNAAGQVSCLQVGSPAGGCTTNFLNVESGLQINGNGGALLLYNAGGAVQSFYHFVTWSCTLATGNCTITLTGSAAYTSTGSYVCTGNDTAGSALAVSTQNQNTTSFKVFGTLTDTVTGTCIGT